MSVRAVARVTQSSRKSGSRDFQKPYDCTALSHWLALFVTEVRKTQMASGIHRKVFISCFVGFCMRKQDAFVSNFLDQKDGHFRKLQGTCESVFRQLR